MVRRTFDIDGASYDSKSFSMSSQISGDSYGIAFKTDGTKVYASNNANNTVYQYSLGTAWDISTASYDSKNKSLAAQISSITGIYFKPDGTKVYATNYGGNVYQYTLSTPRDISTASYDSKTKSLTSQDTTATGIYFKDDGTKFYFIGPNNDTIYQYTLSSARDISTASYDSKSFTESQEATPYGLYFKDDGTKCFVAGYTTDRVYQYSLSSAWDISTATYDSKSFLVSSQTGVPYSLSFKYDDGAKMYVCGTNVIYQYSTVPPPLTLGEYLGAGSAITKALYHLNGNSNDSSGNGNNGTDTNISYVDGKLGQCASFNGTSSKINLPANILNNSATITASLRIKIGTQVNGDGRVLELGNGSTGNYFRFIAFNTSKIRLDTDFGTYYESSQHTVGTDWVHIAGVISGGNAYIYINGTLIGSGATGTTARTGTSNIMGYPHNAEATRYFNGQIDEVIIENVARDAAKVQKYYTMTKGRFGIL